MAAGGRARKVSCIALTVTSMESFACHHLLLLLLLLLSSCLLFSPAASQERTTILDSDGNSVLIGERYKIAVPNDSSLGTTSPNGGCPPNVFLQTWRYGPPVMLFPEVYTDLGRKIVYVNEDVSVMFASDHPSPCPNSTQWTLNPETGLVTIGGAVSNAPVSFSRFRVLQSGAGPRYNFWSSPSPGIQWHKLGTVGDEKLLGEISVSSKPIEVEFIRVTTEAQGAAAALHSTA